MMDRVFLKVVSVNRSRPESFVVLLFSIRVQLHRSTSVLWSWIVLIVTSTFHGSVAALG